MGEMIVISEDRAQLADLPKVLKDSIGAKLAEGRVAQHIPGTWSGTKSQLTMWGVVEKKDGRVDLRQKGEYKMKSENVRQDSIIEAPSLPGVFQIDENFGILLSNPPEMIPWNRPYKQMGKAKKTRLLRRGNLISVKGRYAGIWRVVGTKCLSSGVIQLDLLYPGAVGLVDKQPLISRRNVALSTLQKDGMEVLSTKLTGCPITL